MKKVQCVSSRALVFMHLPKAWLYVLVRQDRAREGEEEVEEKNGCGQYRQLESVNM